MKTLRAILVLPVLLELAGGAGAGTLGRKKIGEILANMRWAEKGYLKNTRDKEKVRRKIEKDVLVGTDRKSLSDQMGMDQARINSYKSDILDDLRILKAHWEDLTQDQKDSVEEVRESLR